MGLFSIGATYPPEAHKNRIRRYAENKKLFKGEHYDVFKNIQNRLSGSVKEVVYMSLNLPGIIVKKSADFLFGETPMYSAGKEDESPEQKALERYISTNHLNIKNYQSAIGNAYRGDSFYKIRWAQKYGGAVPMAADPFRVVIENQEASYVFPETMPGNVNEIFAYHIAFPVEVKDTNGREYILHVESHYPGQIQYSQFRMNPTRQNVDGSVSEHRIYAEIIEARKTIETGVPMPLVVHVPNFATDDHWEGLDDLTEHHAIFDEINNRLSKIVDILDKHADPAIAVPTGTLGEDENGMPTFVVGRDKVFELMGKDDIPPQYITWNGQLQAAFEELKMLIQQLLATSEIPEVVLGGGDGGTSGSSGLAIKFRMNSLLSKINRKRQFYDKGLKEVLLIAQLLETQLSIKNPGFQVFDPIIHFKDGLPKDDTEQANVYALLTGSGILSKKTALMELKNLTEEQAEKEMKRITDEASAQAERDAVSPSIFNEEADPEDIGPDDPNDKVAVADNRNKGDKGAK